VSILPRRDHTVATTLTTEQMSKVIYTLREESWTLEIPLLPNPPSQLLWRSSSYSVPIYDEHPSVLS
jgi:hypothetical protein